MPRIATHIVGMTSDASGMMVQQPVGIIYTTDDPYALRLDFQVGVEEYVTWTVSIELFECAFANPGSKFGHDAVVMFGYLVAETRNVVILELHSPEGKATVILPAWEAQLFIEHAQELATDDAKEEALTAMLGAITEFLQEQ